MSTLQLSAENGVATFRRREITDKMFSSLFLCGTVFPLPISPARATLIVVSDLSASSSVVPPGAVEMKLFVDPQGLFVLSLPKRFFALRRTAKGDLPDEKTGSGRRGSSIFNAGDLAKAEVLAIER